MINFKKKMENKKKLRYSNNFSKQLESMIYCIKYDDCMCSGMQGNRRCYLVRLPKKPSAE